MQLATKEDLIKYVKDTSNIFMMIMGVIFLIMGLFSFSLDIGILSMIFFLGMGGFLVWFVLRGSKELNTYMNNIEASGDLQIVLNDFSNSQSMVHDNIRMGVYYMFGKKKGRPVRYSEITKVYQHVRKRNFIEVGRQLYCVTADGRTYILCDLMLRGKSDQEVGKIMTYIKYRNPAVHLGYK